MYDSQVIAIAINTEDCTEDEAIHFQTIYEKELNVPVLLPLQQGVNSIIPILKNIVSRDTL